MEIGRNAKKGLICLLTAVAILILMQNCLVPALTEQANAPGISPGMGSLFGLTAWLLDRLVLSPIGAFGGATVLVIWLVLWIRKGF